MVVIVSQRLKKSGCCTKIRLSLSFNVLVNHEEFCCQKHTRIIIRVRVKKPEKNQLSKSVENTDKFENSDENVVLLRGTYLDDMTSGKPSFFPF